jgi:hypothetical protein
MRVKAPRFRAARVQSHEGTCAEARRETMAKKTMASQKHLDLLQMPRGAEARLHQAHGDLGDAADARAADDEHVLPVALEVCGHIGGQNNSWQ